MKYEIREIKKEEYPVLQDFLYEAIYIPEGEKAPDRSVINLPDLEVYVKDFGDHRGDLALVAEADGTIAGAIWVRIMDDYGHVDDDTPSLAVSLYKEYRGLGIGTELLKKMLDLLRDEGYCQVSLSVQKANYAVKMYEDAGFRVLDENEEDYIMVCRL